MASKNSNMSTDAPEMQMQQLKESKKQFKQEQKNQRKEAKKKAKELESQERELDEQIDQKERVIENMCMRLLLHQQPVARDLRQISSALKMITDLERIGDQASDIAEIILFLDGKSGIECSDIKDMATSVIKMVNSSIEAYVKRDLELAKKVQAADDEVDALFDKVKNTLVSMITKSETDGEFAVDMLMIAKYFERIGDHAVNVAEWVEFSLTGVHKGNIEM